MTTKSQKPIFIYLASQSARRRDILKRMGIKFRVVPSLYHEKIMHHKKPEALVLMHAKGKARKAKVPRTARFILAADTIVWCRGKVLGKPADHGEAFKMLAMLSGRSHEVYTGVVLWDRKNRRRLAGFAKTKVYFKRLSPGAILRYLKVIRPHDKAGAYAIQAGPRVVKKIEGSYTNVVGLPVELLREMLKALNQN